jgi:stage V sporulation protein SpoVS
MAADTICLGLAAVAELGAELERKVDAGGDGFAVQQCAVVGGVGFKRVGEGVAEVQQRTCALLRLVGFDDTRFEADGGGDGLLQRFGPAEEHAGCVLIAPIEKFGIADERGFDDLGVAGAHLATIERGEHVEIGEHQFGLVNEADEVLAFRRIDRGFAADAGIDLREQCRRDLHEVDAAFDEAGCKA